MDIITILKAALKNIDNTETYMVAQEFLENLIAKKVPGRILNLYILFIKGYETLKFSCKILATKIKNSPNQLDNYCLQQGLKAVKAIATKVIKDAEDMAKLANIEI